MRRMYTNYVMTQFPCSLVYNLFSCPACFDFCNKKIKKVGSRQFTLSPFPLPHPPNAHPPSPHLNNYCGCIRFFTLKFAHCNFYDTQGEGVGSKIRLYDSVTI